MQAKRYANLQVNTKTTRISAIEWLDCHSLEFTEYMETYQNNKKPTQRKQVAYTNW